MYRKVVRPKLCTGFEVAHEIQILKEIKMGGTSPQLMLFTIFRIMFEAVYFIELSTILVRSLQSRFYSCLCLDLNV